MDEIFDNATLAQNGYTLDKNNALLDSNGNYLESITIGGKTMNSAISAEEFEKVTKNNAILAESNFSADPYSSIPIYIQEEKVISEYYIQNPYEINRPENIYYRKFKSHLDSINANNYPELPLKWQTEEYLEYYEKFIILDKELRAKADYKDSLAEVKLINKRIEKELVLSEEIKLEEELNMQNMKNSAIDVVIVLLISVLFIVVGRRLFKKYSNSLNNSKIKIKYYFYSIIFSFIICFYLGFKFKTPRSAIIYDTISPNGREDVIIDYYNSQESFFGLNNFNFNWELFIIIMLLFLSIIIFLGNTIYYDRILAYIKSIKRI